MKIHISHSTKVLLESRPYVVVERGKIEIKGKGEMKTYFLLHRLDERGNPVKMQFMDVIEQFKQKEKAAGGSRVTSPVKNNGFINNEINHSSKNHTVVSFEKRDSGDVVGSQELDFYSDSKGRSSQRKGE